MIPLLIGASWMFGAMAVLDIKFNLNNIMAFPLILGIGIDDGVHILHRYIEEGKRSIDRVIKYTGRAVLLTSLTTIIAFGVMAFGSRRGIASFGLLIAIGVGCCFFTSVFVLPAIITLYEKFFRK
jgi:predicted RND superfamily exporter protein